MSDYDGNNSDPTSQALNKALLRNTQLSQENAALKQALLASEQARLGLRPGWLENIIASAPQRTVIDLDALAEGE